MEIPEAPAPAGPLLRGLAAALLLAATTALSPTPAAAQVASQSVNMVSGIRWPGGDPFLQRQNEPSVAMSSRNPRHLLAGANDYRAVDLPFSTPNAPETGDAWLGVFKSFDGGITWRSTLLPGYPQQVPRTGPLSTFTTAADPVVRAGTNGLFYYSGIAFNRDTKDGVVFVARFMDLNNKENGDPTLDSDPIRYIDTKVVDSAASSAPFIDKPWIAVDKPRLLDGVCRLTVPQPQPGNSNATVSQTVPAGAVYAAWTEASGTGSALTTNVFFSSSSDCGGTWSRPVKLNGTNKVNQGATIAIDPATGVIYVVWRRFASGSQTDAIMITRSFRGVLFSAPSVVVSLPAYNAAHPTTPSFFDQGTTEDSFRTNSYPTIAIDRRPDAGSEDDDEPDTPAFRGKVFVAWSQRGIGPGGDARVVLSASTDGGSTWSAPQPVDNSPLTDDTGHVFSRGHQFMPQMTVTADKITIIYYDARFDHTFGLFSPRNGWDNPLLPDPVTGKLYLETRDLRGELLGANGLLDPNGVLKVFTPFFVETGMTQWRHTIDLRFAQADAAVSPVFSSSRLSQYSFGTRGDETGTVSALQQLQINPPNLKLFQEGSVPFIGDYIDVAGPTFLPPAAPGRRWRFNSLPGTSPVFLASWTSNQDVRPPRFGSTWADYTPAGSTTTGGTSVFNGTTRPACVPGNEGMRNQNIYAARISQGLAVTSVQNAKPLSSTLQRDLALSVENLTPLKRTFRLTIAAQPTRGRASFVPAPNPLPNPLPTPTTTLDVVIPANSAVARSVYALSTDPHALIEVDVAEVNGAPGGPLKTNGLTGFVTFNTDPSAPNLIDPDGTTYPSVTTVEIYNPNVSNPNVSNPNVSNPNVSNPNVSNPNVSNPNVSNPNVSNPNVSNADLANPNVSNPNVSNPNVSNPNVSNPNVSNPNVSNAPVSDATYTVTNTGNTAATYRVQLVGTAPGGTPLQLIITKPYANPASLNCVLFEQQHNIPVANVVNPEFVSPGSPPNSGITDPSDGNATFVLGPGESLLVTIRAPVDVPTLTNIIQNLAPVVVAHAPNTNDLTNKPAASPPVITTSGLPDGVANQPYSALMTALGGTPPYHAWTATGLPPGLLMNASTGLISGTPSAGTFAVNVSVADSASKTGSRAYTLDVVSVSGPAVLTFTVQPANATGRQPMPSVKVQALDFTASPVPGASITMAPGTFPCSAAILSGPMTAMTDGTGVATFSGLSIDRGGWGYTLTASVTGNSSINVTSNAFNVEGFCATGSLSMSRISASLTTLADGRVLLAGGDGPPFLDTAEVYDPATGLFTPTAGHLAVPRRDHQAVLLPDGKVLIVGGRATTYNVPTNAAELFDPTTGTFSPTTSPMITPRARFTATWIPSAGKVLITGGEISAIGLPTAGAEVYDPATQTFSPTGSMTTARAWHTASLLQDGRVLVVGGYTSVGVLSSAELWDPTPGTFTATGALATTRWGHAAVTLSDGRVLVVGGTRDWTEGGDPTAQIYDPASGGFTSTSPMAVGRFLPIVAPLPSGKVLVTAGFDDTYMMLTAEVFDPASTTFAPTGSPMTFHGYGNAVLLSTGRVLLAGAPQTAELFFPLPPTVFLVTNTADAGAGSLRQAILDANAHPGLDAIHFNIPDAGVQTISPASALPVITDPVLLDATTQPGYVGTPLIRLDGGAISTQVDGLTLAARNSAIRGVAITRFLAAGIRLVASHSTNIDSNYVGTDGTNNLGNWGGLYIYQTVGGAIINNLISGSTDQAGISLYDANGTVVQGNRIGTDATGTLAIGNPFGLQISGHSTGNKIGGSGVGQGNLISGNYWQNVGVFDPTTHHNVIEGNTIGTDISGNVALTGAGSTIGILIEGSASNTVRRNLVSGNALFGIEVENGSVGNLLQNNKIGTNLLGIAALPNGASGVALFTGSSGNLIGGVTAADSNLISGNVSSGILMMGTSGDSVQGNLIGTDVTGTTAIPNGYGGVVLYSTTGATIGGTGAGAGNLISGNTLTGLSLGTDVINTLVAGNQIGTNATGSTALPNSVGGVSVFGATTSGNVIRNNVISGNLSFGVQVSSGASQTLLAGNVIGTNLSGAFPVPNVGDGVELGTGAHDNIVGGATSADANVIAFNTQTGILVRNVTANQIVGNQIAGNGINGITVDYATTGTVIAANRIGTNAAGNAPLGNAGDGIGIYNGANGNILSDNVIAASTYNGVRVNGSPSNTIRHNWIGTNAALAPGLGNANQGISISASNYTVIGGAAGDGNVVAYNAHGGISLENGAFNSLIQYNTVSGNAGPGVGILSGAGNAILSNSIFGNTSWGIFLSPGANDDLAAPAISSAVDDGSQTTVIGVINLGAPTSPTVYLQFFANDTCEHPPAGEGKTLLGTVPVVTDDSGMGQFIATFPTGLLGKVITATTSTFLGAGGNTSEFSACLVASGPITGSITEFSIPTAGSGPENIAAGPDGALWFTEWNGNKIGRITTAGAIAEFVIPTAASYAGNIAAGPDGALWFTETGGNKIGKITTAGAITEFVIPTGGSDPAGIASGPDNALWFAEWTANRIGRITTTGAITEFVIPTVGSGPNHIAVGPDGALWFSESGGNKIGRITTAGAVTEFLIPTAASNPSGIAAGPDGALWFAEWDANKIGRITTAGAITEFVIPTAGSHPARIAAGPDGALWFSEYSGNKIGRITTAGAITEFAIPTSNCWPIGIAAGPDGALWFTEWNGNQIGRLK